MFDESCTTQIEPSFLILNKRLKLRVLSILKIRRQSEKRLWNGNNLKNHCMVGLPMRQSTGQKSRVIKRTSSGGRSNSSRQINEARDMEEGKNNESENNGKIYLLTLLCLLILC
jgi:hypothetical protein